MRLLNRNGRATLLVAAGEIDVAEASGGKFPAALAELYNEWRDFSAWAETHGAAEMHALELHREGLGAVTPVPGQVLAVGLNYVDHAAESGFQVPEYPIVFTKFASSIVGPFSDLELTSDTVDWEVELVAVVGIGGRNIAAEDAWKHLAGLAVGQDYSDRDAQFRGHPAQFSLGKSFAGFGPIGPVLVSPNEFLAQESPMIECLIDGEVVQSAPVADMVFSIPDLVQKLSAIVELRPGDAIFTGTPPGVGLGQSPPKYLRAGQVVTSRISGLGEMEQRCVAQGAPKL